jgi:uncharacterized NAD(P)/FAD-binding protein YdhS
MIGSTDPPLRLAVIGGGFTGAALIIHAIKAAERPLSIDIIEPAAQLGRGAAYGTSDPAHRTNVPSDRMSLFEEDATHFTRWLFDDGRLPDRESTDALGRHYVSRSAFGAYVEDNLKRTLAQNPRRAELRHRRLRAVALRREPSGWRVELADGSFLLADKVALCTGHSLGAPCPVSAAALQQPGLVRNPWAPDALSAIRTQDRVLIVGTGLTMGDVVATLDQAGHQGPITAVSRRALLPRQHGRFALDFDLLDGSAQPRTTLELLRLVRKRVREAVDPADWQSVIDALRTTLPEIWRALPPNERLRATRRLLPFWEVHRFRISPQVQDTLASTLTRNRLTIKRASVISIDAHEERLTANLRMPGGASIWRSFESIVLCAGPSKNLRADPLLADLLDRGLARLDEVGLGLDVDPISRVLDARGAPHAGLLAIGPMTRGCFGEMTGAPDIARHIERIVGALELSQASGDDLAERGLLRRRA